MSPETLRAFGPGEAAVEAPPLVAVAEPAVAGRRRTWLVHALLAHADVFALMLAFFASERMFDGVAATEGLTLRGGLFLLTLPLWIVVIKIAGLYDRHDEVIGHTTLNEVPKLFQIATMGVPAFAVGAWALGAGLPSATAVVSTWVLAALLLPAVRALVRAEFQRHPDYPQNTLIVGAGTVGQLLARKLRHHPEYRLNLLGFVDDLPRERRPDLDDLKILGGRADLADLVDRLAVERVVVAFSKDSTQATMDLIRVLKDYPVRIDIVPRLFDVIPPRLVGSTVEGIPLLTLPPLRLSFTSRFLKRALDLVVASLATLFLAPVFALIAILIKLDSPGPVFFRQQRMGAGETPFGMFKFRTMFLDADSRKHEVAYLNKHLRPGGDPRMFKIQHDPRVTKVGRVLRRYSLDELPQLLNVLKGDMSLIGPRPLILEEDRFVEAWARKRLLLKPGMTGLWQVLGRTAIPFEEMVKLDYLYVTTWSLANDCKLLLQTIPLVIRGEPDGAY